MTAPAGSTNAPVTRSGRRARMNPWHWVLLIVGTVLALIGLGLTIAGTVLLGADAVQRTGRYLTGDVERFQSTGYALVSPAVVIDPGQAGMSGVPPVGELVSVQVRAAPVVQGQEVFIGLAEADRVSAYLQDVPHSRLGTMAWDGTGAQPGSLAWTEDSPPWPGNAAERLTAGTRVPADPAQQDFWAVSASGTGVPEITWQVQPGRWSLVVMNADSTRPVWVELQAGVRSALTGPVGTGLLVAGLIGLVVGVPLLLWGTAGLGRDVDPARSRAGRGPGAARAAGPDPAGTGPVGAGPVGAGPAVSPVRLSGVLEARLSRGLWLVKWLLAIPHYLVLALLWIALVVTTIAAGIAILVTGRYPRSWFLFSVGVLRWSWRVGFYAYSALGTDRYPPFTLAPTEYPAELDVAYPQRLSRGLVLVKWWLLAIPHLLIVGILTGGAGAVWGTGWDPDGGARSIEWAPSLLGVLVLIAAVVLLFTGRYRDELFALIVGLNRWVYRVMAYVVLLRDEYPPFRLDQGPAEPPAAPPVRTSAPVAGPAAGSPQDPGPAAPPAEQRDDRPPGPG